ncbi:arginine--tRNA ligase [bacterium]|nr:MAG: arginine--tRNA ligase [bacterium]RIK63735.1 MAG: arginine--tRNA ligase [Planctomycetota bacterium]
MDILRAPIAQELARWPSFRQAGLTAAEIQAQLVRPPKRDMGDVALGCFVFAKAAGVKPNEVAAKLAAGDVPPDNGAPRLIEGATAAGPYVNFKLNRAACMALVLGAIERSCPGENIEDAPQWNFGAGEEGKGKTLVLDFSSPNIAKPLAVHHLRSTMIGYAIKKMRESQGWRVVGINHLGDWGTGFGKLIAGLKKYFPEVGQRALAGDARPLGDMTVQVLIETYQRFNQELKQHEDLEDAGKREFALLERHIEALMADRAHEAGPEGKANFLIWEHARNISLAEFERVYAHLGISFHLWPVVDLHRKRVLTEEPERFFRENALYIGESYYVTAEDLCRRIIADALELKVAEESEGAMVIYTHGKDKPPIILVKNDGATAYHTRDMAAALYRHRHFNSETLVYVVGGEQRLHFQQLFKGLELLGHAWAGQCAHVDFGLLLFKQPDGKWAKASTRAGRVVMLEDLLDEAVEAVRGIIREKNQDLARDAQQAERVAHAVGVGAVVFNDLKSGRRNDIKFDWDEILNFTGETGPYMLMQFVRMGSVTEKFHEAARLKDWGAHAWKQGDCAQLKRDDEWELVLLLANFPEALRRASADYEPSIVAKALIEVAAQTSSWWTNTKDTRIVGEDAELSKARVRLVNAVRKVLGRGLLLLGMTLVERM